MSLRGTTFVLDSRRRDALATYARLAAEDAGIAPQAWVRRTWGLESYEAKALLRGDGSEPMWERIVKSQHPEHGGWRIVLAIYGAVIGHSIEDFITNEKREVARERASFAAREAELAQAEERLRQRLAGSRFGPG